MIHRVYFKFCKRDLGCTGRQCILQVALSEDPPKISTGIIHAFDKPPKYQKSSINDVSRFLVLITVFLSHRCPKRTNAGMIRCTIAKEIFRLPRGPTRTKKTYLSPDGLVKDFIYQWHLSYLNNYRIIQYES